MNTSKLTIALSCIILFTSVGTAIGAGAQDFSYSGATGPARWGDIKAEYAVCRTGMFQSPTNLMAKEAERREIRVDSWTDIPEAMKMKNTGLTVDIEVPANNKAQAKFADRTYTLKGIHYHMPSEHLVEGKYFEGEMHFVHAAPDGQILVIGTFLSMNTTAQPNPFIESIKGQIPAQTGQETTLQGLRLSALQQSLNMNEFFTYQGSLTTPPCTENVRWIVMRNPIALNADQYAVLKQAVPFSSRGAQFNMDLEGRRRQGAPQPAPGAPPAQPAPGAPPVAQPAEGVPAAEQPAM